MDDIGLGVTIRNVRIRRGWRQLDLAHAASVSRTTVSRVEAGHLGTMSIEALRRICSALDIRLELLPRWRGGDLGRMLSARHSVLHESVAKMLARDFPAWTMAPEVSFSIW